MVAPYQQQQVQIDLYIGFDLGTSSSKVVIGNPEMESTFPVVFRETEQGVEQFLVPTAFEETASECRLVNNHCGSHSNFKLRLMDAAGAAKRPSDNDCIDLVVYAALILRYSVKWFGEVYRQDYGHFDIVWNLAVGFPRKEICKNGILENAYHEILSAASVVAGGSECITRAFAAEAIKSVRSGLASNGLIHPDLIKIWPEIAAQLAGYMRSPYQRDGNLVLIDVGAGTLDISAIILHGPMDLRQCSFHHCAVEPLGAFRLYEKRRQMLLDEGLADGDLKSIFSNDVLAPVPESLAGYLNGNVTVSKYVERVFRNKTLRFMDKCIEAARERIVSFRQAQKKAHLNTGFDPWPGRLPVILSGGGSRLKLYDDAFRTDLEEKVRPYTRWMETRAERERSRQGFETVSMPVPDDLDLRKHDVELEFTFDRISVAHGLSYGAENLPIVTNLR